MWINKQNSFHNLYLNFRNESKESNYNIIFFHVESRKKEKAINIHKNYLSQPMVSTTHLIHMIN